MVASSTLVATFATLLFASQPVLAIGSTSFPELLARQSDPIDPNLIPQQCRDTCVNSLKGLQSCTDINCICKDSTVDAMVGCLNCGVNLKNSGLDTKTAQNLVDAFVSNCKQAGVTVKSATVGKSNSAAQFGLQASGAFAAAAFGAVLALA